MNKTIIILGAGNEHLHAYLTAKKLGIKTIGVDKNKFAIALKYSNYKIITSIKNVKIIKKKILQLLKNDKKINIKGILTVASDVPVSVSILSKFFNTKSISIKSALAASNKIIMKQSFIENNVRTPNFKVISNFQNLLKNMINRKNYIIKPSDSRGARGVFLINNKYKKMQLKNFFNESKKESSEKKILLEDYLNGPQISTEGIFIKKKYKTIGFSDRNYSRLEKTKPYVIEDGGSMPSKITKNMHNKIDILLSNACKSLGINFGTIKGDVVIYKNVPYIIELAARISGGYMATHTIRMVYNFDLVKFLIKELCDIKQIVKVNHPKKDYFACQRYFFFKEGKINKVEGIKNLSKNKKIKYFNIYKKKGDYQQKIKSHPDRSGVIILIDKKYNKAITETDKIVKKIKTY